MVASGQQHKSEGGVRPNEPTAVEEGRAFVQKVEVNPTGSGALDGLCFAVKDLIDLGGYKPGCGNPTWRDTHPPASVDAVCVEQLLAAGARCVGKTVTDELAFSLLGENHFYGTPLNPKAPDRVPGGSSGGSASAVACGLVDFALGTDTGGSVRVPASNCGTWGLRPSHGFISVAGVNPFAPTFATLGIFARSGAALARAASILLGQEGQEYAPREEPSTVHLLREAFSVADPEVRRALAPSVERLRHFFGGRLREFSLREIDGESEVSEGTCFQKWYETYSVLQWAEIESCLGAWVAATNPAFGPEAEQNFELVKNLDRRQVRRAAQHREEYFLKLKMFLGANNL